MSIRVNVHMSKIMRTPTKVGVGILLKIFKGLKSSLSMIYVKDLQKDLSRFFKKIFHFQDLGEFFASQIIFQNL